MILDPGQLPATGTRVNKYLVINEDGVVDYLKNDAQLKSVLARISATVAEHIEARDPTASRGRQEVPVETTPATTDRAIEYVTLAHPAGIPIEAKYGYLHSAAIAAGLEWGRENVGLTSEFDGANVVKRANAKVARNARRRAKRASAKEG